MIKPKIKLTTRKLTELAQLLMDARKELNRPVTLRDAKRIIQAIIKRHNNA